jgi:hypothetical protein
MVVQKRPSPFRNVETGPIVTSGRIRELASYWEAKRAGRAMPVKREIDPAEIKSLLPYLMIAELHRGDTLRIRYRLVGTEAARYAEEDYTNLWLDESGWQQWEIQAYLDQYCRIAAERRPLMGTGYAVWQDHKIKPFEWAKFPLSDGTSDEVAFVLGIEDLLPPQEG